MATRARSTGASGEGGGGSRPGADRTASSGRIKTQDRPAPPAAAAPEAVSADQDAVPDAAVDLTDRSLYINRELSMLAFQRRVLEEARDERNPLIERVKFLSILGSNLGEFFMVRVAGLRQQVEAGVADLSADGMTPAEQLVACREQAYQLMREARETWVSGVIPQLAAAGVHIHDFAALDETQRAAATAYFNRSAFPVLTPLAFDPGRPFPHISNLSLNLAVLLRDENGQQLFARVKVPSSLPRLVTVPPPKGLPAAAKTRRYDFVWLEQLIAADVDELFPGMTILGVYTFRVTRDAEMSIQELEADDLLETIEEGVLRRRFGSVVRLTIDRSTPDDVRRILLDNLDLEPEGMVAVDPPLGMSGINLLGLDRPDLKDAPFVPAVPRGLDDPDLSVFAAIREHDVLIHRPYDSFEPVIDWLETAAHDPDVLAIKMTLYRVGRNAPAVAALLEAARNGKEVAVLVELKARFDEEPNIEWARALEEEGVHVVYGLVGVKTHSKIGMVVRREGDGIRRYVHLGTGNYNVVTARLYTDLDLFTCDEVIGQDATELFNFLTGFSRSRDYKRLLVGPINLRESFEALLEREIEHQRAGRGGHLIFKMNSLIDRKMIAILYRASQAGVKIDLLVRGMCSLRPGIPGVSDNIKVTSIVGRFLEHSRIYWFRNGGDEQVLVGSADLMPRNLNRRVEVLFPVQDPAIVRRLRDEILAVYLRDNVKARFMRADGSYIHARPPDGQEALESQAWFIEHAADRPASPRQSGRQRGKRRPAAGR
jgi:polyphosphate kinase